LERTTYISYLINPSDVGKKDKEALEKLISEHPYCQSAYVLLAKIYHDNGNSSASSMLRKAALYTSNRALLKQLIEPQPTEAYPSVNLLDQQRVNDEVKTTTIESAPVESSQDSKNIINKVNEKAVALNVIEANDQKAQGFIESLYQHLQELSEAKAKAAGKKIENSPSIDQKESIEELSTSLEIIEPIQTLEAPIEGAMKFPIKDIESNKEIGSILNNIQKDKETSKAPRKSDVLDLILGFDNQVKDYFDLNTYQLKETPNQSSNDSNISNEVIKIHLPFNTKDWTLEESRLEEVSQNTNELLLNYLQYISQEKQKQKNASVNKEQLLIKKFIEEEPSITKNKYPLQEINENQLEDDIEEADGLPEAYINENFAKTLTIQKNYVQAISVYEALILKNPEKKSYFASLIEELKLKK
jgi:hypothetical protein